MSVATRETISVKDLSAIDPAQVDLIDVRTPGEYARAHAAAARLAPLDSLDPRALAAQRKGPADAPIYLICKSGTRAEMAARKFRAAGIHCVCVVAGGTDAWVAAGLPVVRGKGVISLERQVRIVAGLLVVAGVALAYAVHPYFLILSAFVGAGLVFAGVTDTCGMGMVLSRMPWNTRARCGEGQ